MKKIQGRTLPVMRPCDLEGWGRVGCWHGRIGVYIIPGSPKRQSMSRGVHRGEELRVSRTGVSSILRTLTRKAGWCQRYICRVSRAEGPNTPVGLSSPVPHTSVSSSFHPPPPTCLQLRHQYLASARPAPPDNCAWPLCHHGQHGPRLPQAFSTAATGNTTPSVT